MRRVLDAALVELSRVGYADFRIEAVARRAEVNKTTIYRRWPSRVELVGALVERMQAALRESPLPDTGELERDLVMAFERRSASARTRVGRAWARLLAERRQAEVEALVGAAVRERRGEWATMVTRAIERGELPADTDAALVLELVRAIVDARPASRRVAAEWLTLAVNTVLAGARAGTLVRRKGPRGARGRGE